MRRPGIHRYQVVARVLAGLLVGGCAGGAGGDGATPASWTPAWLAGKGTSTTTVLARLKAGPYEASSLAVGEEKDLAQHRGDALLGATFASLAEDAAWHRAWSEALVAVAFQADAANRDTLAEWVAKWNRPVHEAVRALGRLAEPAGAAAAEAAIEQASAWQRRLEVGR